MDHCLIIGHNIGNMWVLFTNFYKFFEQGIKNGRIIAVIIIICVCAIFLCCCAAGIILHDYFAGQRNQEIIQEEINDLI